MYVYDVLTVFKNFKSISLNWDEISEEKSLFSLVIYVWISIEISYDIDDNIQGIKSYYITEKQIVKNRKVK